MLSISLRRFFLCLAVSVGISVHAEPEIIGKARAFLGPETTLEAVRSVRYVGTLVTADPADLSQQIHARVEIVFQKPSQQRISIYYEKNTEQTALDGYEGWHRQQDPTDVTKWRQTLLPPDQIKRLRSNTLENLSFYRGLERYGVAVDDAGAATVDGVACRKLTFTHGVGIVFTRYFDLATGRLVLTETDGGGSIREQGQLMAGGARFPRTIVTISKRPNAPAQIVTITFEEIAINETFPQGFFAVPPFAPEKPSGMGRITR